MGMRAALLARGLQNTTQLACTFGNMNPVPATFVSATKTKCPAPNYVAGKNAIVVEATVNGVDFSVEGPLFTQIVRPIVLSIHPAGGPLDSGTSVFLIGAHFFDSEDLRCSFGTSVVLARWLSNTLAQCNAPRWPKAETLHVEISINGRDFTSDGQTFTFYQRQVLEVFPSIGFTDGGTLVSIFGEGFTFSGELFAFFGLSRVKATFVSSTQLRCVTPQVAEAATVNVSVTNDNLDFEANAGPMFTYTRRPSIEVFEPRWSLQGEGANFVVKGGGFINTSNLACSFGGDGLALRATYISENTVSCAVPVDAVAGAHSVDLTLNGRDFTTNGMVFVVLESPDLLSITPASGPCSGGTAVSVKGVNFERSSGLECLFGSRAVPGRWETSTSIWCTTPPNSRAGTVKFAVTLDGLAYSSSSLSFRFCDCIWPQVIANSINNTRNAVGDTSVETCKSDTGVCDIDVDALLDIQARESVEGNYSCFNCISRSPQWGSSTAKAVGGVVRVVGNADIESLPAPQRLLHINHHSNLRTSISATSSILSVVPDHGVSDGGTYVLMIGTNFEDSENLKCRFGTSHVSGRWLSSMMVSCVSIPGQGGTAVPVDVEIDGMTSVSVPVFFSYRAHPTVSELRPSFGSLQGGTLVSIYGDGFEFSSSLMARFGHSRVPATFISPSELRSTSPASSSGTVNVVVGNHDISFASSGDMKFTYGDGPAVLGIYPTSDSIAGGLSVKVRGHGFSNSSKLACRFGDAGDVPATFVAGDELWCVAPPTMEPTYENLEVTLNGNDFTSDGILFRYTLTPIVLSITPDSGRAGGGTAVLIEGVNFVDSVELTCQFGSSMVSRQWISSTMVQCVSPAGIEGSTVQLSIAYGTKRDVSGGLPFLYYRQATIHSIWPTHGSAQGGTNISVLGAQFWFSGDIRVRFGLTDVPATFVSPSELRCVAPSPSPGSFNVSVAFNGFDFTELQSVVYSYVMHPKVTDLRLVKGAQEGRACVTASGGDVRNSSELSYMLDSGCTIAACQSEVNVVCATPQATNSVMMPVVATLYDSASAGESRHFTYMGDAYMTSAHPNGGSISGGTSVRVDGYNFEDVEGLHCIFGSQAVLARWISYTQVRCISPASSDAQVVRLDLGVEGGKRVPGGTHFSYYPRFIVSRLDPIAGSVDGGTVVNLVGDTFTHTTALRVMFGPTEVPVTFFNSSLLQCVTIASPAKTVGVDLSVNGRDTDRSPTLSYTFFRNPSVASLRPFRGSTSGGTTISVTGAELDDTSQAACRLGAGDQYIIPPHCVSAGELLGKAPAKLEVGSYPLEVPINGVDFGQSGNRFSYHDRPFVTSVRPTYSSSDDGASILVTGGYFEDSESILCHYGPVMTLLGQRRSATLIECASPVAAKNTSAWQETTIPLSISFNSQKKTAGVDVYLEPRVSIAGLHPGIGSTAGGTSVVFRGNDFGFNGDLRCRFGLKEVPVTFVSPQEVRCVSPVGEPGSVRLQLEVESHPYANVSYLFEYINGFVITTIVTKFEDSSGIVTAFVSGSGFENTSQLACRFERSIVVQAFFASPTEIACELPVPTDFGVRLLEVTVDGNHFAAAAFRVSHEVILVLTINPASGPRTGGTVVEITGMHILGVRGIACAFGQTVEPALWLSEDVIQCETPSWQEESSQALVSVIVEGHPIPGRGSFQYSSASILSVSPLEGEVSGGTIVVIAGSGFDKDSQWYCWFGFEKTLAVVLNERGTSVQCVSPPLTDPQPSVLLTVSTSPLVPEVFDGVRFTYVPTLQALSMDPASGSISGGSSIVVTVRQQFGANRPPIYCKFGALGILPSTWLNDTALRCVTPRSPARGQIRLTLSTSGNTKERADSTLPFWYFNVPTISFVFPLEMEVGNTAVVTLLGGSFEGTDDLSCRVGGVLIEAQWVSESVMNCPLHAIPPGKYEVAVSNNAVEFVRASERILLSPKGSLAVGTTRLAPGSGPTVGLTSVEVVGPEIGLLGPTHHCTVGDLAVNARGIHDSCVCCSATADEDGGASMRECDNSSTCGSSCVEVPWLARLSPQSGPTHLRTPIVAEMQSFCGTSGGDGWCKVGNVINPAPSVKSTSVVCVTPASKAGPANVTVSCDGQDFSAPRPFTNRLETMVYDVSPLSAYIDGSSIIHVRGRGFPNFADGNYGGLGIMCLFNETSTSAVWISEALVICRTPSQDSGVTSLRVSTSSREHVLASVNFTYVSAGHHATVKKLSANFGPTARGTTVGVVGKHAGPVVDPFLCAFGETARPATRWSSSAILCKAPPVNASGHVKLSLTFPDLTDTIGASEYNESVHLHSVSPSVIDIHGGTNISILVSGNVALLGIPADLSCRVGNVKVPAHWQRDASRVECIAPARPQGNAAVSIWDGDHLLSHGDLVVYFTRPPVVSSVVPAFGSSRAQSVVDIRGYNFVNSPDLACIFGGIDATHVKWLSHTQLRCTPPLLPPGVTHVTISLDGAVSSAVSNSSMYTVPPGVGVWSREPFVWSSEGDTMVPLKGNHFTWSGGLEFEFSVDTAPATVLNGTDLKFGGPRPGELNPAVAVRLTGRARSRSAGGREFEVTRRQAVGNRAWQNRGSIERGKIVDVCSASLSRTAHFRHSQDSWKLLVAENDWSSPPAAECTLRQRHGPEQAVAAQVVTDEQPAGAVQNSSTMFDLGVPPLVERIYPTFGPESGRTRIRVSGATFGASEALLCVFCSKETKKCITVSGRWSSPREVECTSPRNEPGLTTLKVTDNGVDAIGDGEMEFLFVPVPHVAALSPNRGTVLGGTRVVVSGINLAFAGSIMCRFGEQLVKGAFYASRVVCTAPPVSQAQDVHVEVSANGVDFSSDKLVYHYYRCNDGIWPLTIYPSYGDMRGGTLVTVAVERPLEFDDAHEEHYECIFGDEAVPVITTVPVITCLSPTFISTGAVRFRVRSSNACSAEVAETIFEALPPIQLLSIEPASGWESGGDTVVVRGYGLGDTALVCCRFGKMTAAAELLSISSLRCSSPPWSGDGSTAVLVEVSHNCYDFYGNGVNFQYRMDYLHSSLFSVSSSSRALEQFDGYPLHCRADVSGIIAPPDDVHQLACVIPRIAPLDRGSPQSTPMNEIRGEVETSAVLVPSSGPVDGGTEVLVSGVEGDATGALCIFTDGRGRTVIVKALPHRNIHTVSCLTPPWSSTGSVTLHITGGDVHGGVLDTPFVYYLQPVLLGTGRHVLEGLVLLVAGIDMVGSADATCGFFDAANIFQAASVAVRTSPQNVQCLPPAVQPGKVTVEFSVNGIDYTRGSGLEYTVTGTPVIFSLSPSTGISVGGTEVTVHGKDFEFESEAHCRFEQTTVSATVVDASNALCKAPAATPGPDDVSVVDFVFMVNGGEIKTFTNEKLEFAYLPTPSVTGISPRVGPVAGGLFASVTGHRFMEAGSGDHGTLGGKDAKASVISAQRLICQSPPHDEGIVVVAVRTDDRRMELLRSGHGFPYSSPILFSSFKRGALHSRASAWYGGTQWVASSIVPSRGPYPESMTEWVEVEGDGSTRGAETLWSCCGDACCAASNNLDMPHRRRSGCRPDAIIVTIQPNNGPRVGGTPVRVTGIYVEVDRRVTCHFGRLRTLGIVLDIHHVVCSSPPVSVDETVVFSMTIEGCDLPSGNTLYHYEDPPSIARLRPRLVYVEAATTDVMIEGYGFRNSSSLACKSDDHSTSVAMYLSSRSVICVIARKTSGSLRLEVTNNGIDFSTSGDQVMFTHRPIVTDVQPLWGGAMSESIVFVSGLHFMDIPELSCLVGERAVSTTWLSAGKIRCKFPPSLSPGVVDVSVTLNGRQQIDSRSVSFEYVPTVDVDVEYARPPFGATDGGTKVIVHGTNLQRQARILCRFGTGADVVARVVDHSTVECVSPAGLAGPAPIRLGTNEQGFISSSADFSFIDRPRITGLKPSSGSLDGGTAVTIVGSGFINDTALECRFGAHSALSVVFLSSREVVCEAPPSAIPSVVSVTTRVHGVPSRSSMNYRYTLQATVFDVLPREIVSNGSTWLSVVGDNFVDDPALACFFNNSIRAAARRVSPGLLRCSMPPSLTPSDNPVLVGVSNNGRDISTSTATLLIRPRSTIHRIWPLSGTVNRSTLLNIFLRSDGPMFQHQATRGQVLCRFDNVPTPAVVTFLSFDECSVEEDEKSQTSCVMVRCATPVQLVATQVPLLLVDAGGSILSDSATFTYQSAVRTPYLSPSIGEESGGTPVIVYFGSTNVSPHSRGFGCQFSDFRNKIRVNGELIERNGELVALACLSPPWQSLSGHHTPVSVDVFVDGVCLLDASLVYVYSRQGTVVSLAPEWGRDTGGTKIIVKGVGFSSNARITCTFIDSPLPFIFTTAKTPSLTPATWLSDEEIWCESPAHPPGTSSVVVIIDGEPTGGLLQFSFRSTAPIHAVNAPRGPTSGGTVLSFGGKDDFLNRVYSSTLGVHHVPATFVHKDELDCISLSTPLGLYPVAYTTCGQDIGEPDVSFKDIEELSIATLTPRYGWTTGGDNVSLSVVNLKKYEDRRSSILCSFGDRLDAPIIVDFSAGMITCSSPTAQQAGLRRVPENDDMAVLVTLVWDSGATSVSSAQMFYYLIPVTVTAVAPDRGQRGTSVRVSGENFDDRSGLECQFGALRTPAIFMSSQMIRCDAANGTGSVSVTVLSGGILRAWHTGAHFQFESHLELHSIIPNSRWQNNTTSVMLVGSGFQPSDDLTCRFGEQTLPGTAVNRTHVRCLAPSIGRGTVQVAVAVNECGFSTEAVSFTFDTKEIIRQISPEEGSVHGGTALTIMSSLSPNTSNIQCTFKFEDMRSVSVRAKAIGDAILCKTPPSPGLQTGRAAISVAREGECIAEGASFKFVTPPVALAIYPHTSRQLGGERLVVFGDWFVPSNELACRFSDTNTSFSEVIAATFLSKTKMSCVAPVWQSVVAADVHIALDVTTNGVDFTIGGPQFVLQPFATITSASPGQGPAAGGTAVAIIGSSFPTVNLRCRFGTSFVPAWILSVEHVLCISPQRHGGGTGTVTLDLTVDGRAATTYGTTFTYLPSTSMTEGGSARSEEQSGKSTTAGTSGTKDGSRDFNPSSDRRRVPVVVRLEPMSSSSASAAPANVLVNGENFVSSAALTCSFGRTYVKAIFISTAIIWCPVPHHTPAVVVLEVANDGVTFSASGQMFTFRSSPSVLSVHPTHGAAAGLTLVTVTGNQLRNSSGLTCRFGDVAVPGVYLASNQLQCWTPPPETSASSVYVEVCGRLDWYLSKQWTACFLYYLQ